MTYKLEGQRREASVRTEECQSLKQNHRSLLVDALTDGTRTGRLMRSSLSPPAPGLGIGLPCSSSPYTEKKTSASREWDTLIGVTTLQRQVRLRMLWELRDAALTLAWWRDDRWYRSAIYL